MKKPPFSAVEFVYQHMRKIRARQEAAAAQQAADAFSDSAKFCSQCGRALAKSRKLVKPAASRTLSHEK